MQRPRLHVPRWVALAAATLAVACAAEEPVVRPSPVDPKVLAQSRKDFGTSLQETRNSAIKVKDQAASMIAALDRLVDPKQTELRASFDAYSTALAVLDSQAESMKRDASNLRSDGQKFLSNWEQDLASYANKDLREDGQSRRDEVLEAYTEAQSSLDSALGSVAKLQTLAGDVKKYLGNTLSVEGVEKISSVADDARESSDDCTELIDAATEAIDHLVKELPS